MSAPVPHLRLFPLGAAASVSCHCACRRAAGAYRSAAVQSSETHYGTGAPAAAPLRVEYRRWRHHAVAARPLSERPERR